MEKAKIKCISCGDKTITDWKKACTEGCPSCGSFKIEIDGGNNE